MKPWIIVSTVIATYFATTTNILAAEEDINYYKKAFLGNGGSCSFDGREDDHDLATPLGAGPRTGCHGDTFESTVAIQGVDVKKIGTSPTNSQLGIYEISLAYGGSYNRRGYSKGCVHTATEHRATNGRYTFTLTERKNNVPLTSNGTYSMVGEVQDLNHDSNKYANCALSKAISSANYE